MNMNGQSCKHSQQCFPLYVYNVYNDQTRTETVQTKPFNSLYSNSEAAASVLTVLTIYRHLTRPRLYQIIATQCNLWIHYLSRLEWPLGIHQYWCQVAWCIFPSPKWYCPHPHITNSGSYTHSGQL